MQRRPREFADKARDAALSRLADQAEVFPILSFDGPLVAGLTDLDAAFAHAIYDATLRRWFTLEYIIRQCLRENFDGVEPPLKSSLLAGAAQLLLLDRVPPHAAVSETVNWAKWVRNDGAGGLVNAVLRRVVERILPNGVRQFGPAWAGGRDSIPLEDGRSLLLGDILLPEDDVERIAVATSHPRWLPHSWIGQYQVDRARDLALHTLYNPPTILNLGPSLAPQPPNCEPHQAAGHAIFSGTRSDLTELLASRSDVWVQDPSSSAAIESIADLRPRLILDVCAGQGTKTRQLARTFPSARIIATDTDERRLGRLRTAVALNPRISIVDLHTLGRMQSGTADLVLLDVPCTNTGVLARRVEARYRCDAVQLERMVATQRQILADSLRLLKPDGAILYATCSLDPQENQHIVEWAEASGYLTAQRMRSTLPACVPGQPASTYTDGSFSVLLQYTQNPPTPRRRLSPSASRPSR
jgi:16S rRNA (cytosine967-C5)-methyltransferase